MNTFEQIKRHAFPVHGDTAWQPVLELCADKAFVLIGEASHGTHEFYATRAHLTRLLIEQHGFNAVAVEADWPAAYRVNRYVRGQGSDDSAVTALGNFQRFPRWMWRNTVVRDFVSWLHDWNARQDQTAQTGFYGLDLYSLYDSIDAVLRYLKKTDQQAYKEAVQRYHCFKLYGNDPQLYGYRTSSSMESCEDLVVEQLLTLQQQAAALVKQDGPNAADEYFYAEQNARLVKNAEAYYRSMFRGRANTWNMRDSHMFETLLELVEHLQTQNKRPAKTVIWAHNSHLGDARATEMGQQRGEHNLGQLVRQHAQQAAVLIGFTTYAGTVSAASDWDGPLERKTVRPGMDSSYEQLLHQAKPGDYGLILRNNHELQAALATPLLERAIGVIYRPETERWSHYFAADLAAQFDVVLHYDHTRALEPLDQTSGWEQLNEVPDTFPFGQ